MDTVFIDSSAFIALYNKKDISHEEAQLKASEALKRRARIFTSNFIIDETLTYLLTRAKLKDAVHFGEQIFEENHEIEIIRIDEETEKGAWQVFKKFNRDKRWSFTDCTSYVFMKNTGIDTVFTFDDDLRQMGFKVL